MAKVDEREGNSCHIHVSLRDPSRTRRRSRATGTHGMSPLMEHFLAGQLACLRELTLCFAPNVNSYKRFVPGSFAPTAVAWGVDNRTCALRVVGHGPSVHLETRVPGGDVNPYLAVAALIAAGLHGIDARAAARTAGHRQRVRGRRAACPVDAHRGRRAVRRRARSARAAFGDDVVDHYVHAARVELAAFESAVTDWERIRGFERL